MNELATQTRSSWLVLSALWLASACGDQTPATSESDLAVDKPPVVARSTVDKAVATTGDVITYRVVVERDPEFVVQLPEPGAEIAGFRVIDLGRDDVVERDGRLVETRWYKLRADLVGSYILPQVSLSYRAADADNTAEPEQLQTSEIFVEVESVLPSDGEVTDIRDLKALRETKAAIPWTWIIAALLLVLGAGVLLLIRRRLTRPAQVPVVPAHELAFQALNALRDTDFSDPEAVRVYYFQLSEIVRCYVEGRYTLNATDLTTEEILQRTEELADLSDSNGEHLRSFLLATDQVKFAAYRPSESDIKQAYESALGFVEITQEREPELQETQA